jgi:hypothetical protein
MLLVPSSSEYNVLAAPPRSLAMTARYVTNKESSVRPVVCAVKKSSPAWGVLLKEVVVPMMVRLESAVLVKWCFRFPGAGHRTRSPISFFFMSGFNL